MAVEVIDGGDLFVFMEGVLVGHTTSFSISRKRAVRNTSNKDSGDFETNAKGRKSISISCSGMMVYASGLSQLMAAWDSGSPVTLEFGEKKAGDLLETTVLYESGDFICTGVDTEAGDKGTNVTYSATFDYESGYGRTPFTGLIVSVIGYDPASAAAGTAGVAAFVHGGIQPYTYAWTFGAGGSAPTVLAKNVGIAVKAAVTPGTVYTCTVTDSTPVTPLTGVGTVTLIAAGA